MGSRSDCLCWEIMQCENSDDCPAKKNPHKPCWEIAREQDNDYRHVFNVCRDCIVRVLKEGNSDLTNVEIKKIVNTRTNCRLSHKQTRQPPPAKNPIPCH